MSASQTVSAVIPVHNGSAFLAEAIRSVLAQTLPVRECIVVDDGSTDDTRQVVAEFGDEVRYLHQRNSGVSAARNRGADEATGEFVAFLDHDDVWEPEKLERQLSSFGPEHGLGLCAAQVIYAGGRRGPIMRLRPVDDPIGEMLMFTAETVSCSSTGVLRRDRFRDMGGFDPGLSMSADWDLLVRAAHIGRIAYVDDPLVLYRVHETNMSRRIDTLERDMRRAFDKTFADPGLAEGVAVRRSKAYGRLYRMLAGSYRDSGNRAAALRAGARAVRYDPGLLTELVRCSVRRRQGPGASGLGQG